MIFNIFVAILGIIACIIQYDQIIKLRGLLSREVLSEYDRETVDMSITNSWLLIAFFSLSIVTATLNVFGYGA